jgi:hypothetical protein
MNVTETLQLENGCSPRKPVQSVSNIGVSLPAQYSNVSWHTVPAALKITIGAKHVVWSEMCMPPQMTTASAGTVG